MYCECEVFGGRFIEEFSVMARTYMMGAGAARGAGRVKTTRNIMSGKPTAPVVTKSLGAGG